MHRPLVKQAASDAKDTAVRHAVEKAQATYELMWQKLDDRLKAQDKQIVEHAKQAAKAQEDFKRLAEKETSTAQRHSDRLLEAQQQINLRQARGKAGRSLR